MTDSETKPNPPAQFRLGSYYLQHQLGAGGMSSVFRGVHAETGSVVAIKVLSRDLAKNVTLLQRFLREARSAEALDHSNIVAIYDRGFDQGRHYLILEYVEGCDLHERVRRGGPLPVDLAVRAIRQTAEGLHYAAGLGMIHRDIKPANLLLDPDGNTKIIDLGLALQRADEDERVTRDGTTVGTVDYMAPEQARDSRKTSVRSDIYSLGCTFYYLLVGTPPFAGGTLADKLSRHFTAPIPDPRLSRPDLPRAVADVCQRMMAKGADHRYADHAHLIQALDAAVGVADPAPVLDALIDETDEMAQLGTGSIEAIPAVTPGRDRPRPTRDRGPSPTEAEINPISLRDLALLDGDPAPETRSAAPRAEPRVEPKPVPRRTRPSLADILEEEAGQGAEVLIRRQTDELPLKTWIMAGVLIGLGIAVFGIVASYLIALV